MPTARSVGILGSAEFAEWPEFRTAPTTTVPTEHGTVEVRRARLGSVTAQLLIRGGGRSVAAHRLNHRANLAALRDLGVHAIVGTAMVGSLTRSHGIGTIMVPDQILDFMRITPTVLSTSSDYQDYDFTEPYDAGLRADLLAAAERLSVAVSPTGCYVGVDGPRFETRAEVEMYRRLGGDVIGMTGVPEAAMARELGLPYATVVGVVNLGAGIDPDELSSARMATVRANLWISVAALIRAAIGGRVAVG